MTMHTEESAPWDPLPLNFTVSDQWQLSPAPNHTDLNLGVEGHWLSGVQELVERLLECVLGAVERHVVSRPLIAHPLVRQTLLVATPDDDNVQVRCFQRTRSCNQVIKLRLLIIG